MDEKEISVALATLESSGKVPTHCLFPMIALHEPSKEVVQNFSPGTPLLRQAFAVILDRQRNQTFEAIIDLSSRTMAQWKEVPGVQSAVLEEEFDTVPEIVRQDPKWRAAMNKRGVTRYADVLIDLWAPGTMPSQGAPEGARLLRALSYYRAKATNPYARPIEGVVAVVNVNTRQVVELVDTGVIPIPAKTSDFDETSVGRLREAPKPLRLSQPAGKSFEIRGHEIRWQKWRFRYALHPREGLVLYTVGYEDAGRLRSILYRGSLSEMVVPYADPEMTWAFRNAFDEGEYGVGRLGNSLVPSKDAPSNAVLLDAVFAGDTGKPYRQPKAVALYEADGGILWRHWDYDSDRKDTRRARQLVLMYVATIGNYDYAFNWIFHQDGRLEVRLDLTGILLPKAVKSSVCSYCDQLSRGQSATNVNTDERYGHLVAANIVATHHQHFVNFRLDFDVDGPNNSAAEMNTRSLAAGPDNPYFNAFTMEKTVFQREVAARRGMSMQSSRKWHVFNPSMTNSLGHLTGFTIMPHENAIPYALPEAAVRKRARLLDHHFWVTRYKAAEMNAAGYYPNQSKGGDGLLSWTQDDESIVNQDIVLWYTMGITHNPRPEEWPIMSAAHAGFELLPSGFFDKNPALDVPGKP